MRYSGFIYPEMRLEDALVRDLMRMNPWWSGQPGRSLPATHTRLVGQIHQRLSARLAPVVVVCGPRQIGKSTAQLHVLDDLLARGVPARNILRVQFDELSQLIHLSEPILRIVDWYEATILKRTLNAAAQSGESTYLAFDEVQNLACWAEQLKALVDASTTQVLVTGSSALRIEIGRGRLAGRITTIEADLLS